MIHDLRVYYTEHTHSQIICRAFAAGSGGVLTPIEEFDVERQKRAFFHGILRGCGEAINQCRAADLEYYYSDHGYFRRGYYNGYFRITRNDFQASGLGRADASRWERLGIQLSPWRRGRHILLVPPSPYIVERDGLDGERWIDTVRRKLADHTSRVVIVRTKDSDSSLSEDLEDAHALVTYNSNAAVDAIVAGVPVFCLSACAGLLMGSADLSCIERPRYPKRDQWAWNLAANQWKVSEMVSGKAWRTLNA